MTVRIHNTNTKKIINATFRVRDGRAASAADLTVRIISNGQPHRALPLTGSLCTAVAAGIEGSIPNQYARRRETATLRIAMPSGVLTVGGEVIREAGGWRALRGSFFRTTRRLFDGYVYT